MPLRLAYSDHRIKSVPSSFLQALKDADIELKIYDSPEEFSKANELENFPVFLCHPGLNNQCLLGKIAKEFQKLKIGLISFASWEYCETEIPVFSYELPESVINWVRENQ